MSLGLMNADNYEKVKMIERFQVMKNKIITQ